MGRNLTPTSDFITLGNLSTAQFLVEDTWSLLVFFRLENSSVGRAIVTKWRSGGNFQFAALTNSGSPPVNIILFTNNAQLTLTSGNVINLDEWYLMAVTCDGLVTSTSGTFYIMDMAGTFLSDALPFSLVSNSNLAGSVFYGVTEDRDHFDGDLADGSYTRGTLTRDEINGYLKTPHRSIASWREKYGVSFFHPLGLDDPIEPDFGGEGATGTVIGTPTIGDNPPVSPWYGTDIPLHVPSPIPRILDATPSFIDADSQAIIITPKAPPEGEGVPPPSNVQIFIQDDFPIALSESITLWEAASRAALDKHGPVAISNFSTFSATDTYPGSVNRDETLWDGTSAFLMAYLYYGCTDQPYLDAAVATANTYDKWAREGLTFDSTQLPYRPVTFQFYPFGLADIFKLDPNLVTWDIPNFFSQLVDNCQFGEISALDIDEENGSREVALTILYYMASLRVGNTLPATSRFDTLVAFSRSHVRQWIKDGPDILGVTPFELARDFSIGPGAAPDPVLGNDDPYLKNLAPWFMNVTLGALIQVYEEHPSYQSDSALLAEITEASEWLRVNGPDPVYQGAYWSRFLECRDCSAEGTDQRFSLHCTTAPGSGGDCWSVIYPWSKNPGAVNDKQYDILTGHNLFTPTYLFTQDGDSKWLSQGDFLWNGLFLPGRNLGPILLQNAKQMNENLRGSFDYLKSRVDPTIYTTLTYGTMPCSNP